MFAKFWRWLDPPKEAEFVCLVGESRVLVRYLQGIGYKGDARWARKDS